MSIPTKPPLHTRMIFSVLKVILGITFILSVFFVCVSGYLFVSGSSTISIPVQHAAPNAPVNPELCPGSSATQKQDCLTTQPALSGPITRDADLPLSELPIQSRLMVASAMILPAILVCVLAILVLDILRGAERNEVFTLRNVRRLDMMSFLVGIGFVLTQIWAGMALSFAWSENILAATSNWSPTFNISLVPIVVGLGIGALSTIWRYGVKLQSDSEGLV